MLASERKEGDPIVVAGGICVMANPEPVSKFIDLFILGDIEATVPLFMKKYLDTTGKNRHDVIQAMSRFKWVYNPVALDVTYASDGTIGDFKPHHHFITIENYGVKTLARLRSSQERQSLQTCSLLKVHGGVRHSADSVLGNMYPFNYDRVERFHPDIEDIGIIGGGVSYHPRLVDIIKAMKKEGKHIHLPSLRVDETTTQLVELIQDEIKTLTFGIEAGSERLRKFIGKPLTDDEIYEKLETILVIKPFNLKLYFMIGLYGEDKKDLEDIISMVKHIHHIMVKTGAPKGIMGSITVHVSPFVPQGIYSIPVAAHGRDGCAERQDCMAQKGVNTSGQHLLYPRVSEIQHCMAQRYLQRRQKRWEM